MKRTTRGFTLIELLVVIAIIALLVSILMPGLGRARELAKRASCATNVSNIGKALAMYQGSFGDSWPMLYGGSWGAATGAATAYNAAPTANDRSDGTGTNRNVSAILFLLVRDGQSPNIFICPSTEDKADATPKEGTGTTAYFHWDFTRKGRNNGKEAISYSYQCPRNDSSTGTNYISGANSSTDPAVAILADRTVSYLQDTNKTPDYPWDKMSTTRDFKTAMSQNHGNGEYINALFADTHVGNNTRADIGYSKDNIYTYATANNNDYDQVGVGTNTPSATNHKGEHDSYLIGPMADTSN